MSLVQFTTLLLAVALVAAAGCGDGGTVPAHDAGPDATGSSGGSGGTGSGGAGAGDPCAQCVSGPPDGWAYPVLVWMGDEKDAPSCPPGAGKLVYEARADLDAPTDCGTCSCGPPMGSCGLPATMTANAASCTQNGASTPHTPFDPSEGWDGTCDTNESIPSGKLCSGIKCVQSLTVAPLTLSEGGCPPSQPPMQAKPTWKTFARACATQPPTVCGFGSQFTFCLAAAPPGFHVCIFHEGDEECSGPVLAPYSEKHVFYQDFQDTRACSPCSCGSPSGGSCSTAVSVFTDGACSTPAYSTTVTSAGPACHDLPAGSPLGSKSATAPTYTPGSCVPSGGEPMGAATPLQAATYCCLPSP